MVWIYLGLGIVALLLELVLPGGIAAAFGLACLMVSAALALGWIESPATAFMLCGVFSVAWSALMVSVLGRISRGDHSVSETDEDVQAFGQIATVVRPVNGDEGGRIRFHGSDWPAISRGPTLESEVKVKIVGRENLIWVVEPEEAT